MEQSRKNIFIFASYSHRDRGLVKTILSRLEAMGFPVWDTNGMLTGQNWSNQISEAIGNCTVFLTFISRNYTQSEYCQMELTFAFDLQKTIIPVYLEDLQLSGSMSFLLGRIQRIRYEDNERFYTGLHSALRRYRNDFMHNAPPEHSQEMLQDWLEQRRTGDAVLLNELKVVFLGDGEAGKSYTIARLLSDGGDPQDYTDKSTPGIVIKNKQYIIDDRMISVHFWDFGGQEILHSMHRIFLTDRTLYVVLVNARDETQDSRARYWLHNIKSFAPNAPVMLVLNKMDQNPKANVNESDLRSRYPNLSRVVKMSALEYSRERFNREFQDVLLQEIQKTGFLNFTWPVAWTRVKRYLEKMESHLIRGNDYREICRACGVETNEKDLLHWFNDLGVSFCCCDEDDDDLEDYVILKPDWITNALYIMLFNECEGAENGLIPHKSIRYLLKNAAKDPNIRCVLPDARYDRHGDFRYVMGVLERFQLAFQGKEDHEFLPMLCQRDAAVDVLACEEDPEILEFLMEFEYLPNNVLHRLMVERQQELDMDNVWLTGARFAQQETGLSAVVVIDENQLRLFVSHENDFHRSNTYLAQLKANVDRIRNRMGLPEPDCRLIYKCQGQRVAFRYERLLKMQKQGIQEDFCEELEEKIRIEDVLNQSAPAAAEDQKALLDAIIGACRHLQGNKKYWDWNENDRNSVVRDSLRDRGYVVLDQTLLACSGTGNGPGELDLDIRRIASVPWTVCEALIAEGYTKKWNEHLNKLLNNYNPYGLPTLYLLTYVDCEKEKFGDIWEKYRSHIRKDNPAGFGRGLFQKVKELPTNYAYIKAASCSYKKGRYTPTVFFLFVRMGS